MKYTVTIRERVFEVDLRGGDARVDGEVVHAALHGVPGSPLRLLVLPDGAAAYALEPARGGWVVHTRGEVWEAQVEDERTRRLREVTGASHTVGGHVAVKAPMPGRVVRVDVRPGDAVRQGQGVVVLEAMKMENELSAPIAGRVTAVHVAAGAAVTKGTPLVDVSGQG